MTKDEQHEFLAAFLRYISLQEDRALCFYRAAGSRDGIWLPCPDYLIRHLVDRYLEWQEAHTA